VIVDLVRGQAPPFDPQNVTRTFAALVKGYGLRAITGDNYAASWVETAWLAEGVVFERSKLSRSELYLEAIPLFTRELISLPNHPRLLRELRDELRRQGLELDTLSMGMSADLEAAIAEGSTMVRIGSAIFGERHRETT